MLSLPVLSLVSLLATVVFAGPHGQSYGHSGLARRARGDIQLAKRFDDSKWSYYAVGQGACGKVNYPNQHVVALNSPQYGGGYPGPQCGKQIVMSYKGKTTTATIVDECPGCPYGGLDLSEGLFAFFDSLDKGIIYGSWQFAGQGDGPKDTPKPDPKPSTTEKEEPPKTPEKTPEPSTTQEKKTSTTPHPSSTKHSEPSSSAEPSASASAEPSASLDVSASGVPAPSASAQPGNASGLDGVNRAALGMVGLVVQAGSIA